MNEKLTKMNEKLIKFARDDLKKGLAQCTEAQQLMFKRMYAGGNLELSINDVVDQMSVDKLDWAMEQVDRTLAKATKGQHDEEPSNHD